MIKGLFNVLIKSENVKKLASFYSGKLGLAVKHDCPDCVGLDLGNSQWLIIHKDDKGPSGDPGPSAFRVGFGLLVDDVDAVYKKLEGDVKFPWEPADQEWGVRTVTGFDPEGHKIEFVQEKPSAKSAKPKTKRRPQ